MRGSALSPGTFLILAAVGLGPWLACSKSDDKSPRAEQLEEHEEGLVEIPAEARANAGIRTAPAEAVAMVEEIETTGQVGLDEDRVAHVGSRVAGRIAAVNVTLGQAVRRGQSLAVIDSAEVAQARADYQQAKAQEDLARTTYERETRLAAEKISSESEVLAARATLLEIEAARRRAEETLRILGAAGGGGSLVALAAPLDGVVVEKEANVGEVVGPEEKLFTVADLRRVWVWIDVFEVDLRRVHLEDDVVVAVDAFPGESFQGKVSFLSPQVDAGTRTVRARIDVANDGLRLRPGMFARIQLSDPHQAPAPAGAVRVVVPESALQREGDGFVVFVEESPGRYHVRPVLVGRRSGGKAEVLDGLRGGERVAVEGVFFLASEAKKETLAGEHGH